MSKQFWIVLLVIAAILGGILFVSNHNQKKTPSSAPGKVTEHVEGKGITGVKLVEYGDYQCPICAEFYPAVKQAVAQYGDRITFQFSNLPLPQIHQNAFAAARAAEAAGLQGKYFEMHDLLYQNQSVWSGASNPQSFFETYARQLGLNVSQFQQDYASEQVNKAINADTAAFNKTGDELATPTFYLDGKKLDNGKLFDSTNKPSVAAFTKIIDAEIAQKNPAAKP